jgi:hypothetical protein
LEAAKGALLEHLQGLGSPTKIGLIEFTSTASVIFEGESNDVAGIKKVLDALTPRNGTEIAAALDQASAYLNKVQDALIIRVLVVSDGLSDRKSAGVAADRLVKKGAVIDVILIDPTSEGEAVARAIAINGTVSAVTSSQELLREIGIAKEQEDLQAKLAAGIMKEYEKEEVAIAQKVVPQEKLSFTAGYPGTVSFGTWYPLLVYLHLAKLQNEVEEALRRRSVQLSFRPSLSTAETASPIKRGTMLRLTPRAEGFIFNPSSQDVAWYEDVQDITFRLQAESSIAGHSVLGCIEVYVGPILIAQIPLAFIVRQLGASEVQTESVTSSAQVFSSVFASYSHHDTSIVDACVAAYTALGIYVYIDKHSLRSGQEWKPMLHQLIDRADLFQLYWSNASCQSPYVEDEWRHALSRVGQKSKDFIRPLYWERPLPPPPNELGHIHFAPLDLDALSRLIAHPISTSSPQMTSSQASTEQVVSFPSVHATILPTLPDVSPVIMTEIREDISQAVTFLEETTNLRYYPVATLLVDEHIVKSVRALNTVDLSFDDNNEKDHALAWAEILRSICLEFHVRKLLPQNVNYEKFDARFGSGSILTSHQFDSIRSKCEWIILSGVKGYLGENVNYRDWERWRNELINFQLMDFRPIKNFVDFMTIFLKTVHKLLHEGLRTLEDFGYEGGCPIHIKTSKLLHAEILKSGLRSKPKKSEYTTSKDEVVLHGRFSAFLQLFDMATTQLTQILQRLTPVLSPIQRLFSVEVPTYGIYASPRASATDRVLERWAFEHKISIQYTLPQTPRVLFCLGARQHFEEQLKSESTSKLDHHELAKAFQRCVIIHEHFHAILETGLNTQRSAATGPQFANAWRTASSLNESLAVWMELHFARQNSKLMELVSSYIQADSYPRWPYRGAEYVEILYQQHGIDAVRDLIVSLRQDPESAQLKFDALIETILLTGNDVTK